MRRRDPQKGRRENDGVLSGHYRQGRVFKTPLTAYDEFTPSDWVREDLPDLAWPALVAYMSGTDVVALLTELQRVVLEAVPATEFTEGAGLDGRLTSLETIRPDLRPKIVEACHQLDIGRTFPAEVVALGALYEDLPGAWLLTVPWPEPDISPEDAATAVARAFVAAATDNNALVKAPVLRWELAAGRMTMQPAMVHELLDFPNVEATRKEADASIRSGFLAAKLRMAPSTAEARDRWAASFWRQNWHRTDCWPEEHGPDDSESEDTASMDNRSAIGAPTAGATQREPAIGHSPIEKDPGEEPVERAVALFNMFLNVVLDRSLEVDLHHPEKYEVLTGLVARAARATIRTLHHPDLWSGEHGMTTMRILAETEIVIRWMAQSEDADVYRKYQNYGRGKRKLMRRHLENLRSTFESPPDFLNDAAAALEVKTGGDWGEEFQDVSIDRTFANRDLRQMAGDVGLEDLYRHVFQPASGISHGEWWAIEDYSMQRCMNPLHRFHMLPSFDLEYPITIDFPKVLDFRLRACMSAALDDLVPSHQRQPDGDPDHPVA